MVAHYSVLSISQPILNNMTPNLSKIPFLIEEPPNVLRPVIFDIAEKLVWSDLANKITDRLEYAAKLNIPHLPQLDPHEGTAAIVGAGPSLTGQFDRIKDLKDGGACTVFSVNGAHNWLIERGVTPHIHVLFEWDVEDVKTSLGGEPHKDVVYYVCSHCDQNIFKQLEGHKRILWHFYGNVPEYHDLIIKHFPEEFMVSGGHVTFFRSMTIATILGHRKFELFGIDSSFEGSSHVEAYSMADIEPKIKVWGTDPHKGQKRQFTTQGGLAFQAHEFLRFCEANQAGLSLRVNGDGLLRYLHEARYPEQYQERN